MARRMTLTYGPRLTPSGRERPDFVFYLATNTDVMQFYLFDEPAEDGSTPWTLIDQLDRAQLQGAGDLATAKLFAKRLGLKSWTYVRI